jgi:hypothetical protein
VGFGVKRRNSKVADTYRAGIAAAPALRAGLATLDSMVKGERRTMKGASDTNGSLIAIRWHNQLAGLYDLKRSIDLLRVEVGLVGLCLLALLCKAANLDACCFWFNSLFPNYGKLSDYSGDHTDLCQLPSACLQCRTNKWEITHPREVPSTFVVECMF